MRRPTGRALILERLADHPQFSGVPQLRVRKREGAGHPYGWIVETARGTYVLGDTVVRALARLADGAGIQSWEEGCAEVDALVAATKRNIRERTERGSP